MVDFNPINSEDYVAPLQESYKEINQGMNNYWDQEISNYNRAAEIAGKDMQALADMSSTLGEYFTKKDEERRANDRAKGYMCATIIPCITITCFYSCANSCYKFTISI